MYDIFQNCANSGGVEHTACLSSMLFKHTLNKIQKIDIKYQYLIFQIKGI
jgi:hypothetical protein